MCIDAKVFCVNTLPIAADYEGHVTAFHVAHRVRQETEAPDEIAIDHELSCAAGRVPPLGGQYLVHVAFI